jgi:hypothetical protein
MAMALCTRDLRWVSALSVLNAVFRDMPKDVCRPHNNGRR